MTSKKLSTVFADMQMKTWLDFHDPTCHNFVVTWIPWPCWLSLDKENVGDAGCSAHGLAQWAPLLEKTAVIEGFSRRSHLHPLSKGPIPDSVAGWTFTSPRVVGFWDTRTNKEMSAAHCHNLRVNG